MNAALNPAQLRKLAVEMTKLNEIPSVMSATIKFETRGTYTTSVVVKRVRNTWTGKSELVTDLSA